VSGKIIQQPAGIPIHQGAVLAARRRPAKDYRHASNGGKRYWRCAPDSPVRVRLMQHRGPGTAGQPLAGAAIREVVGKQFLANA